MKRSMMGRLWGAVALTVLAGGLVSPADASLSECQRIVNRTHRCGTVIAVGHRAVEGLNENTLHALRRDHRLGVWFETDTWRLAADDGTPRQGISVINHDSTFGRTVSADSLAAAGITGRTKVWEVTYDQFRMLRTKGGQPLATLKQWIRHAGRWHVHGDIEIDYRPGDPAQVANWVRRFNAPVTFYAAARAPTSNYPCSQTAAHVMLDEGMKVGLKYYGRCRMTPRQIANFGYSYVVHRPRSLTRHWVRRAHAVGLKVGNSDSGALRMWARLVDVGVDFIIAPHPGQLTRWLR